MEKGQISLEYLLVMLIFLGLLGLAAPLINQAQENAAFTLSFKQGQAFAWRLKTVSEELQIFSHGSLEELSFAPPTPWQLKLEGNKIELLVEGSREEKLIELETGVWFEESEENLEGFNTLQLENNQGEIIVSLK
jgi:hypothetical protein